MEDIPTKFTDYYSLLGVEKDSGKEAIQKAFMAKALIYHPDKADEDHKKEYETIYNSLKTAYKILSNDETRRQYSESQQKTHLEFMKEKRDLGYGTTDQFKKVTKDGVKFDSDGFQNAFDQSREGKERETLEKLQQLHNNEKKVTTADYQDLLSKRQAEMAELDSQMQQFLPGTGMAFDSDTFNRAFDAMRARCPGTGLQAYSGDPMAMFSTGGLAETDTFSGLVLSSGFGFDGAPMDSLIQGSAGNPAALLDLSSLQTGEKYGVEHKMTSEEIEKRVAQAEQHRQRYASLAKSQFINEPSDIEKMYSGLFEPSNIEGLAAPVVSGGESKLTKARVRATKSAV